MNIFLYLLQVTICLAAFYGFYLVALQKETTFRGNRFYLLLSMFISLLLPLLKIYIETIPEPISTQVFIGGMLDNMAQAVVVAPQPTGINWAEICLAIYMVGVGWFTVRFLIELLKLNTLRATGMQQMMSGHYCIVSDKIKTPFSFFNTIYLPMEHGFSAEELHEVIVHEHSHIMERHSLDVLCMELFCIVLWISPIIYLYRKKLREVHEYLADAAVLKNTPWEQYAALLVSQTHTGLQSRLSNQFIYSQLKNRLVMMTQKPSTMFSRLKYSGVLPILCVAVILFSIREKVSLQENAPLKYAGEPLGKVVVTALGNKINQDSMLFNNVQQHEGVYNIKAVPNASIQVSAAGRLLREGKDYTINTDKGTLRIINPEYLIPDLPITISFKEEGKLADEQKVEGNTEQPIFPGCEKENLMVIQECSQKKLFEYVAQHLKYPVELQENKIEGKVYVKFVVGLNGLLGKPWIQKSLHPAADQAALDVVNGMNKEVGKWTPGSKEGIPVSMELVLPISFKLTDEMKGMPYSYVEYMPVFPGGTEKLYAFLTKHLNYPKEDKANGLEGTVMTQIVIEPDGRVTNIKILRGVSPAMNAEVVRVMELMNDMPERWKPGVHEGKAVAVSYTIPVKFSLGKEQKEKPMEIAEVMPRFPGCEDLKDEAQRASCAQEKFMKYVYENINYPAEDRKNGNEGKVMAKFVVHANGTIGDVQIIKGVSEGIDNEVRRLLNAMNELPEHWIPGMDKGKAVAVEYAMPVNFVLQEVKKQ